MKEIERKFIVPDSRFLTDGGYSFKEIRQKYIFRQNDSIVRVRLEDDRAFLALKKRATLLTRLEYEYPIPARDAEELFDAYSHVPEIHKRRYLVPLGEHTWEVDVFAGENLGLVTAEIELHSEDEPFIRPDWLGKEVSRDPRYSNASLTAEPFSKWQGTGE